MGIEAIFDDATRRDWADESTDGTIRMAIVGVGGFARERALPAIEASRYAETTVLVTSSLDRTQRIADSFGVDTVIGYDAFRAGEAADAYDAVYVATPNAHHGTYAIAAAENGAHVLCEKPLDVDSQRGREIVDACERAGVVLMVAYRLQFEPTVRRVRELVRADTIGEVVQIHGSFSNPLLDHADATSWRLDADLAGGGALVDLGIYPLNTSRFLLGRDPVTVYASTRSSGEPFDTVDEHVSFQLEFQHGTTADCSASLNAHGSSWLQLLGTTGAISVDSPFGGVVPQHVVVESGDFHWEHTGEPVDEVREEIDYFAYCVLTGTRPEPDGADGVTDLEVIEAAYESAATGKRVSM